MKNLIGYNLGRYELVEFLGQGAMGEVYKAFQPSVERFVAVKVMHTHLAHEEELLERFRQEAKNIAKLQHPHILHLIDFEIQDNQYYMVMDYIKGKTLGALIKETGALAPAEALRITAQLADALTYAHQLGIIHRDIKPSNIMFMDDSLSCPVLTDFGLARMMGKEGMTLTGAIIGTPAYMSPEAVRGEEIDERGDIYSLGVVLYEMIMGHPPYSGRTLYSLMLKQVNEPVPVPRDIKPDIDDSLNALLLKVLAKEAGERFQSATEFYDAIQQSLLISTAKASLTTRTYLSSRTKRAKVEQKRYQLPSPCLLFILTSGVVLLALLTLALGLLFNTGNQASVLDTTNELATSTPVQALVPTTTSEAAMSVDSASPTVLASQTSLPTVTRVPTASPPPPTATPALLLPIEAGAASVGQLRFVDNNNLRVANFILQMQQVEQAPEGSHYELWLTNDKNDFLNLGQLSPQNGLIITEGSTEQNLIARYSRVIISIEPNNDPDPTISTQIHFTGALPAEFLAPIRQILSASQMAILGFLPTAEEQVDLAIRQSELMQQALTVNDMAGAHHHTQNIIKILNGDTTELAEALNGEDAVQYLREGVGVQAHLEGTRGQIRRAMQSSSFTEQQQRHAELVMASMTHSMELLMGVQNNASQLLLTETANEAIPYADEVTWYLFELLNGYDWNKDGLIEANQGEAAILAAYDYTLLMSEISIFPVQQAN